ncbi:nuclease-related domain-containing protein [Thiomicrospira pelophila]|uniref:nuclease-related domain-containing protein n=1 Tax=Thiomicrospira pelophila TaxID=934 RepID=UPI0004A6E861|nr:nuclease-related domain-containing protein [Thiomicrospira pelophila]
MPVLKKSESRSNEIRQIETILDTLTPEQEKIKRLAVGDLKRLQAAERAEQNATKVLGSLFRDQAGAILLSGLRFEHDGQVAQIDHLAINEHGVVSLFETKHFSSGIKLDSKGRFWRWDRFKKRYIEIASPFNLSKLNQPIVKQVLAELGMNNPTFRHFVVVDYKAKLIKPKKGYDNLCRPDRVEKTLMDKTNGGGFFSIFKRLTGWLGCRSMDQAALVELGEDLQDQNAPIKVDYWAKYGLTPSKSQIAKAEFKTQTPSSNSDDDADKPERLERLTMPKLARALNISPAEMELRLIEEGFMEKRGDKTFVTDQGKAAGIQFRKGRRGFFFLLPATLVNEPTLQD